MGEGTNRVDEPNADELADRVERSRERLDTLVAELDQRRHLLARLKEHKVWVAAAVVVGLGAIAAVVQLSLVRRRRQRTVRVRLGHLAQALGRMLDRPERVARSEPSIGQKVLTTAATTLTGLLVKQAGNRAMSDRRP